VHIFTLPPHLPRRRPHAAAPALREVYDRAVWSDPLQSCAAPMEAGVRRRVMTPPPQEVYDRAVWSRRACAAHMEAVKPKPPADAGFGWEEEAGRLLPARPRRAPKKTMPWRAGARAF
jgi:hypothetical protein